MKNMIFTGICKFSVYCLQELMAWIQSCCLCTFPSPQCSTVFPFYLSKPHEKAFSGLTVLSKEGKGGIMECRTK